MKTTLANSEVITFADGVICNIQIVNNIAFVRLEGIRVVNANNSNAIAFEGIPTSAQRAEGRVTTFNSSGNATKWAIFRTYPDSNKIYLTTSGYGAGEELSSVSFSYPIA